MPLSPASEGRTAVVATLQEPALQPTILSTFFPRLSPRHQQPFRWAFLGLGALVVLLIAARFIPLALVVAALAVPLIYLAHFYVSEVYEQEPVWVLGCTFVCGAVLGALLNLALYRVTLSQMRFTVGGLTPRPGYVLLTAVLLPIVAQALMLVGPLVLYFQRPRFDDLVDGLSFGVASGLGFSAAQSLLLSWRTITGALQPSGPVVSWVLPILRITFLAPLLSAATTGLICTVLWLRRRRLRAGRRDAPQPLTAADRLTALPVAIGIALLGQILPRLAVVYAHSQLLNLVWYALVVMALVVILRQVLHSGMRQSGVIEEGQQTSGAEGGAP
jgi:RsiW-degrading membrane proteinase PrsW (M82 family)